MQNNEPQLLLSCAEIDAFRRLKQTLASVGFQINDASPDTVCDLVEGLMFDDTDKVKLAVEQNAKECAEALDASVKAMINKAQKETLDTLLYGSVTNKPTNLPNFVQGAIGVPGQQLFLTGQRAGKSQTHTALLLQQIEDLYTE